MVVPEKVARLLETATVAIAGTRDADLVPHVHRVSAWRLSPDRKSVDCFFAQAFSRHLLSSLEDNGEISVTFCEVPSHETYQLKGKFVSSRPVDGDDLRVYEAYRARGVHRICELLGFSERAVRAYVPAPNLVVRLGVREIFDQTPGPDAGRRLDEEGG
jgi:hypothetical protein